MKEKKESLNGKKSVKCSPVDWNSYKLKQEELDESRKKKKKTGWEEPVVDDKWKIRKSSEDTAAYDFANDEEFNRALAGADKKKKVKETPAKSEENNDDSLQIKVEKVSKTAPKKKSLNKKLDELGERSSNWVSTGNFRGGNDIDDHSFENLENNIINTTKGESDDFLKNAVKEVSEALRDEHGYEPLGEVSLQDTFEIPELNIHFGDTDDLKSIRDEIRVEDLKREIDKLDLAASIELQTMKELEEQNNSDKIIVKSDELKRKRKKKRSSETPGRGSSDENEQVRKSSGKKKPRRKTDDEAIFEDRPAAVEKPVTKEKPCRKKIPYP